VNWLQDVFPETATALGLALRPAALARLLTGWRNASLRAAAGNVAIGARMRDRLVAQGIDAASIRVIPNWAAETAEPVTLAASALRAELRLADRFVVGYSGNLGRAHEFDTFLTAAHLLAADERFVFLVIGGGAKLAALQRAVAEAALDNFRFLPLQGAERVADSMAAANVHLVSLLPELEGLIVPSKYYGVLAAARPVIFIGDADGEVAREMRGADCGMQVDVGAGEELVRVLRGLAADPARAARLGANARAAVLRAHGAEPAVAAWLSLLAALEGSTAEPAAPLSLPLPRVQSGT
jgi:colanic acid biosynthesis glycosyl transferase WcaI